MDVYLISVPGLRQRIFHKRRGGTKVTTYQQTTKELPKFFHLHMVSDASGETLAAIAKAAAVQYSSIRALKHSHPFVRNRRHLDRVLQQIDPRPASCFIPSSIVRWACIWRNAVRSCTSLASPC